MNKLQKIIVWLFRIPITIKQEPIFNVITPDFKNNTEIVRINDTDNIITEFGITEERYTELCKAGESTTGKYTTDVLIELSKECKHQNELAIMSYILGKTIERNNNPLNMLFKQIK